jgi:hypothetical protein
MSNRTANIAAHVKVFTSQTQYGIKDLTIQ